MQTVNGITSYHSAGDVTLASDTNRGELLIPKLFIPRGRWTVKQFVYHFENFFHPFVGTLIKQLNQTSVSGMLDPDFLSSNLCFYKYTPNDYVQDNSSF